MDIWIINSGEAKRHLTYFKWLRKGLTDRKRKKVLEVKNHYCHSPEYRRSLTSQDIYSAVINDDVDSLDSFKDWLSQRMRELQHVS